MRFAMRTPYTRCMDTHTMLTWSWMNVLNKKRLDAVLKRFHSLEEALSHVDLELLESLGCREETGMLTINRFEEFDAEAYSAELSKRSLKLLSFEDEAYPKSLKQLPDFPVFLYARGDLAVLSEPLIAVVGAREMTDYGRQVVGHIVPPFVHAGVVTVSGLAFGVDAEVAKETIIAGGRTVAVLGHGFGMIYPKAHERLADEIVEGGGLILSEFPLDTKPDKFTFPARNRIIAGLSLGTVVAQAAVDSGSLITADLALDYGRDVFAVCGSVFDPGFAGCHQLISRGVAKLVTCAEDVLCEVGIAASGVAESRPFIAESPEEEVIYKTLTTLPSSLDDIVAKAKLDAAEVNATLTMLELKGAVKNVGNGQWVKS